MGKIAKVREDPRFMKPSEAAIRLNLHYTTVYKAINRGELRCMETPGGRKRVLTEDVEAMYHKMYGMIEDDSGGNE